MIEKTLTTFLGTCTNMAASTVITTAYLASAMIFDY